VLGEIAQHVRDHVAALPEAYEAPNLDRVTQAARRFRERRAVLAEIPVLSLWFDNARELLAEGKE
jgi:hypothetical protein